jgi:hypothetical protein
MAEVLGPDLTDICRLATPSSIRPQAIEYDGEHRRTTRSHQLSCGPAARKCDYLPEDRPAGSHRCRPERPVWGMIQVVTLILTPQIETGDIFLSTLVVDAC